MTLLELPSTLAGTNKIILAFYLAVAFFFYWVVVLLYRRYFHPLSHVPGPALAITGLYEFYFDGIQKGQFYREMERVHKIYGNLNF